MRLASLLCLIGLTAAIAIAQTFQEVGESLGITGVFEDPGMFGGGCAFEDINGDGLMDIVATSGVNHSLMVYMNEGTGFSLDEELNCGLVNYGQASQLAFADYNNDGNRDLFVANWGSENMLFQANGDGTFSDVTAFTGIAGGSWESTSACWLDYDKDGWLDLYVTNYDVSQNGRPEQGNVLYHNNGGENFTDVTSEAGVADSVDRAPLALISFDYDNDLDADIFIANDRHQRATLFSNNGNGTFSDAGQATGIEPRLFGMGAAIGDLNHDGWWDLYVTNDPAGNVLFESNGDGTWDEVAAERGVTVNYGCWGTDFFDYDLDGDQDLYVANMAPPMPRDFLFENTGNGSFNEVSVAQGINDQEMTFGFAVGDYDNNGTPDILTSNIDARPYLFRNTTTGRHYIRFELRGTQSNRDGIGAKVIIYHNGMAQQEMKCAGQSYASSNDPRVLFGIDQATTIDSAVVIWPSGARDVWRILAADFTYLLEEGSTLAAGDVQTVVTQFSLAQNYPNPFNPSTQITFDVNTAALVELTVFNTLGQRIGTLINQQLPIGTHAVEFDGSNLSSGNYVYRLTANGKSFAKTMTLAK